MPDATPPPPHDQLPDGSKDPLVAAVRSLVREQHERAGAAKTLSVIWALVGTTMLAGTGAFGTWVWTIQQQVNANTARAQRNYEIIEEHRRAGGPAGHPDIGRSAVAEGRITALEDAVAGIRTGMAEQRALLSEILERLPRRR